MEFLHGPTLEAEIAQKGRLDPARVARIGAMVGRAPRRRARRGALHRDVKPANVVLTTDGRAVHTDFGLGHARCGGFPRRPTPERRCSCRPSGCAARARAPGDDVYALGVTLRCALAGTPPFESATLEELRDAAAPRSRCRWPPPVPTLPPASCMQSSGRWRRMPPRASPTPNALVRAFDAIAAGASDAVAPRPARAGARGSPRSRSSAPACSRG
jgi:serine/threonine protein kinase